MTLREKFDEIFIENWLVDYAEECEKITDEFAIGFAEWVCEKAEVPYIKGTMNVTLEIYKKQNGL
jgi:hypothetical protein